MKTRNLIISVMLATLLVLTSFSEYGMTCQAQETELYPVRVNGKEGYIDATGRIVITPQLSTARFFSEGLACVSSKEGFAWIDRTGKQVIAPQFNCIGGGGGEFHEGLTAICVGDRKGYIDKTGKIVINPQFDMAYPFSEGLALVVIGDNAGYINKAGKYVINPQLNRFHNSSFSEGLAATLSGDNFYTGKHGFIDKTGRYYFSQSFNYVSSFSEGLAYVDVDGRDGFIDKSGNFVFLLSKGWLLSPFQRGYVSF